MHPPSLRLTGETPFAEISVKASPEAAFGALEVIAVEGVELLHEAVLGVQVGR